MVELALAVGILASIWVAFRLARRLRADHVRTLREELAQCVWDERQAIARQDIVAAHEAQERRHVVQAELRELGSQ